jgi:predicted phosphodiesterase
MRYGILSDIHSNLEALQTVVGLIKAEGVEEFLCVGDIVGYGANPKECLDIVRELNMACVAGNHDWAVSGRLIPVHFNPAAKKSVTWTQNHLFPEDIEFLNELGLIFKNDELIMVHGMLSEPECFRYMIYMSEVEETFRLMDRPLCFIGHSHVPRIILWRGDKAQCLDTFTVKVDPKYKYVINVGSVGQPRDGNPMAAYCIYDTDTRIVEVKRAAYDIQAAQNKIIEAGLPRSLAERLVYGQ